MKLVTKNGYKFATGMFWQIPDENKRKINLSKLIKDTKHNMFCQIKTSNTTWGFCHKDEMQGEKNVASLGKFIVEVSKIADYNNCIICYKFKNIGELDDDGRELNSDLYGYIVLLNGTICPDEGEYVATFELVKESIIQKAKKHDIETLYLPVEVAGKFFSIFEILADAMLNDELLIKAMNSLSNIQKQELMRLMSDSKYSQLGNHDINLEILRDFIRDPAFDQKLKSTKELELKYLIANILIIPFTSDEIYWQDVKFKSLFNKALIQPISKHTNQKYKIGLLIGLLGTVCYLGYALLTNKELPLERKIVQQPVVPKPMAVAPEQLINACLGNTDKFFRDLGSWTLNALACNSIGANLTFITDADTTINRFAQLIGKNDNSIKLNSRTGTYLIAYNINTFKIKQPTVSKEQITDHLQQSAIDYGLKLNLSQASTKVGNKFKTAKFSITSKQSPVFLSNHHILSDVLLSGISMNYDKSTGFYTWTLQGEF